MKGGAILTKELIDKILEEIGLEKIKKEEQEKNEHVEGVSRYLRLFYLLRARGYSFRVVC